MTGDHAISPDEPRGTYMRGYAAGIIVRTNREACVLLRGIMTRVVRVSRAIATVTDPFRGRTKRFVFRARCGTNEYEPGNKSDYKLS